MKDEQVQIRYSYGRGKYGAVAAYVRPAKRCFNRSRRVSAGTRAELETKIDECIAKHYPVVNYYLIAGLVIGAKNEEFAYKEYWRVCEPENIKKRPGCYITDPPLI